MSRVPGTRLVRASQLPRRFRIPSTYYAAGPAMARREGDRVRVTFLGHEVLLPLSARVRIMAV